MHNIIGTISMFLDKELVLNDGMFLILRCVSNDPIPSKINTKGITLVRTLSLLPKSTKLNNPDRKELVRKDITKISNLEKYFVSLQIFRRANPERPDVQRNARTSLIVPSPILY